MSDPKLTDAMEDIKRVLDQHDVCAVIILASPTHLEHLTKMHASWSCAQYDGERVHFKADRQMFPSAEAQKECVERTFGIVAGFSDACRHLQEQLDGVLVHLSQRFQIFHRTKRL